MVSYGLTGFLFTGVRQFLDMEAENFSTKHKKQTFLWSSVFLIRK